MREGGHEVTHDGGGLDVHLASRRCLSSVVRARDTPIKKVKVDKAQKTTLKGRGQPESDTSPGLKARVRLEKINSAQ